MGRNIKIGFFFILAGAAFAAEHFFAKGMLYRLWPLLLFLPGAGLIRIYFLRKKREALFCAAGSYLAEFSLLALWLNFTSWDILGSIWPVFIAFAGVSSLMIHLLHPAGRFFLVNGLFFLSASAVFFLVFSLGAEYWWSALILLGLSVMAAGKGQDE